jgi:hypothetical protein
LFDDLRLTSWLARRRAQGNLTQAPANGILISFSAPAEPDLKPDQADDQQTDNDQLIGPQRCRAKQIKQDAQHDQPDDHPSQQACGLCYGHPHRPVMKTSIAVLIFVAVVAIAGAAFILSAARVGNRIAREKSKKRREAV